MLLDKKSGEILLKVARDAIDARLSKKPLPSVNLTGELLNQAVGCFVTITINDCLRGCIGHFVSEKPIYIEVAEMAVAAATADPRFHPMGAADIAHYKLEISILSPLEKIADTTLINVGTHGIYLTNGYSRGVLLPQVALEHKWDRLTFLKQTCIKAGLPQNAWQSPQTEIYIFSAQIISENDNQESRHD
ncbi:AmmeMemoRadiSam system protein A [Geopsychrobacter electrodiphilus]|uniref:AmmeMemoRadiSam system protein A n=1 Tax=Geopsychrobacter electrodiphilus TaxID=225196 RepID=UPI00037B0D4B|nr:AmmeMemoRadiSam system protein A [Geopsychrobacter electrodiphilus]